MAQAQSQEFPKRLPLAAEPENRDDDTSRDAKLINGFIEKDKRGETWWYKRAGLLSYSAKTGVGRGTYNWKGDVYTIYGTTLYKNGVSLGTVDGTNGLYRFDSTMGATPRLVLGNGVKAYTYDGTTFAVISDVDFPAAFVKGWAFLDGTTYVMDASANIQGSAINDPTSWDPLNKIVAQIEPDTGMALAKQLVYVIAFKQWTTEVFYDAGNATGSPLSPVQGAKINFGCLTADSVQNIDDMLIWCSTNKSAAPAFMILDNLKAQKISTKPVERLIDHLDYTNCYSWQFKDEGHRFYGFTSVVSNLTLVYDLDEDRWAQWTDSAGNYWPVTSTTYGNLTGAPHIHYAQHASNGKLYKMDRDYPTDDGVLIASDLYSPLFDGGVDRMKVLSLLHLEGDRVPGSIIQLRYSDDDYTTWSQFRSFDMGLLRPKMTDLGSFYRRAFHFRHNCNTSLRARAGDWQVDLGTL